MTTDATPAAPAAASYPFQAETQQLLDLMIHSLYSNKEIFLRELISNASDALDRRRFEALSAPELGFGEAEPEIRLAADPEARTLSVTDNGIGMSRDEVIANIGTIAKSGTRELVRRLRDAGKGEDVEGLIGQFGVGFYSSFMVADRVELVTRRAGEEGATHWISTGDGTFTVESTERETPGTTVTLHLKPADPEAGLPDLADRWVLSRIVRRHSDFVAYPIVLPVEREKEGEKPEGEEGAAAAKETVVEDERLNSMKPLWTRPESEVSADDYAELYKHVSGDWNAPFETVRVSAEGRIEVQALLFVPAQAPYDLYYAGSKPGLRLYVRRVQVMESCEELLPQWLRFVRGVVDSPDLPLNVSREMLQHDRQIEVIRKTLVKKLLDRLGEIAEKEPERYLAFWREFGRAVKEGAAEDHAQRERLLPLLRFPSSRQEEGEGADEKPTSLADYVSRMQEGQEEIFYLVAESREAADASPHLEAFRARGVEVLYFLDPVDELLAQTLPEFEGKRLKSVGKGTVELGSEEERKSAKEALAAREEAMRPLLDRVQKLLDDRVKQVRLSNRLTTSPACLVGAEHDYSPQFERILMQSRGAPRQRRILELNPDHPVVRGLERRFAAGEQAGEAAADEAALGRYAELLLGLAALAEGSEVADPAKFNASLAAVLAEELAGEEAPAAEAPPPEEPPPAVSSEA
jgi:molecular chaperone HtpG